MNRTEFPFLRRRRRRLPLVYFTERDAADGKEDLIDMYSGWHRRSCYTNGGGWFFWTETIPTQAQVCRFLSQEVRENNGHFIVLTARVRPCGPRDFMRAIQNNYSNLHIWVQKTITKAILLYQFKLRIQYIPFVKEKLQSRKSGNVVMHQC